MPPPHPTPDPICDVEHLEDLLSEPTEGVVETMRRLDGDLLILGAGGKIGPSLARMARRASDSAGTRRRVIAVVRSLTDELRAKFDAQAIEPIRCDLLDRAQLGELPEVPNVLFLAGMKFGSTGREATTWAANVYLPGMVCERFAGSRIVAYSTGNVYGMVPAESGGSVETDPPRPDGDYAMSCLGRERIFTYFSQTRNTPVALIRLNYACEPRYGVLVDLAAQVMAGHPIDLTMGYFNAIWQGDANAMVLRALDHVAAPARVINVTGPDRLSVREIVDQLGRFLGRPVALTGREAPDALLSNGQLGHKLLGRPAVDPQQMIRWIADWQLRGGPTLDKSTHFQTRDGKF